MGGNFLVSKKEAKTTLKKSLIFREMELSGSKLKRFLIFLEELPKPLKSKCIILLQKNVMKNFSKNTFGYLFPSFLKTESYDITRILKHYKFFFCIESFFSFQIFFMICKFTIIFLIILLTFSQITIYSSINFHLLL